MEKIIEIPEGYEARIEGNKVVLEPKESEDERIRKHIIDIIKDNAKSKCIPCDAEIAYLERLKEQKPAEWSKEDEKCCKIALLALNDHPLNQDELKTFNWLRALKSRFGWKPSEEQMDDLFTAEAILRDVGYDIMAGRIAALNEQLKKLM